MPALPESAFPESARPESAQYASAPPATARLMSGTAVARDLVDRVTVRAAAFAETTGGRPCLAAVLVEIGRAHV